ncbi:Myb-like DNA-binding protein [Phytophthora megakarya]|uniref:Myb-like DNA-binding protein n=1 Tax=Phytophthora megakarya TaxID=4795 RepID=A0A225VFP2_9STRA|nr:Myb-like DNA-binding protein [Phytophthora megakarya]
MTHAQKYRQKIQRRRRGLLTSSKRPIPSTSDIYGGIVGTEGASTLPDIPQSRPVPDILALDNLAMTAVGSAFRAFLQDSDPKLFSADTYVVDTKTFYRPHEDSTSIVL